MQGSCYCSGPASVKRYIAIHRTSGYFSILLENFEAPFLLAKDQGVHHMQLCWIQPQGGNHGEQVHHAGVGLLCKLLMSLEAVAVPAPTTTNAVLGPGACRDGFGRICIQGIAGYTGHDMAMSDLHPHLLVAPSWAVRSQYKPQHLQALHWTAGQQRMALAHPHLEFGTLHARTCRIPTSALPVKRCLCLRVSRLHRLSAACSYLNMHLYVTMGPALNQALWLTCHQMLGHAEVQPVLSPSIITATA